jgi:hypothetical protein
LNDKPSMTSISSVTREFLNIKDEINTNNLRNRELRERMRECEAFIKEYMVENNHPGLRFQGKTIMLHTLDRKIAKPKKDREASAIQYLSQLGLDDPEQIYNQLEACQREERSDTDKVKLHIR